MIRHAHMYLIALPVTIATEAITIQQARIGIKALRPDIDDKAMMDWINNRAKSDPSLTALEEIVACESLVISGKPLPWEVVKDGGE